MCVCVCVSVCVCVCVCAHVRILLGLFGAQLGVLLQLMLPALQRLHTTVQNPLPQPTMPLLISTIILPCTPVNVFKGRIVWIYFSKISATCRIPKQQNSDTHSYHAIHIRCMAPPEHILVVQLTCPFLQRLQTQSTAKYKMVTTMH